MNKVFLLLFECILAFVLLVSVWFVISPELRSMNSTMMYLLGSFLNYLIIIPSYYMVYLGIKRFKRSFENKGEKDE